MAGGDFTFVTAGTLYDNTGWVMTDPVTTVGTSPVPWVQFSGAGTYTAGTGLTLTGTVFSVNASQTQITSVGTLTSLTVSGNLSSGNANLGNLATANYVNVANDLNVTGNANIGGGSGGSLTGANNISANTFTSVVATGTAPFTVSSTTRVSNLNVAYANVADFMNVTTQSSGNAYLLLGNALTGNIAETANATFVANTSNGALYATTFIGALSGAATTAGTVTTAAQPNITSVGTLTSLGVNGTVTAVAFTANTGVFTGNGSGLTALNASNISSGTLAQARLANASVTLGNTALTLGSTVTTVAGLTSVTSTSFVGALTGAATTAGTVTTAAQPNITSVGTLSSLAVTGNITAGNLSVSTGTVTLGTLTTGGNTTAGTLTGNWSLSAGSRLQATYADLAEKYVADAQYDSGTVVLFGGELEVTISDEYDSHRVAGVVSTNPAYLMNAGCTGDHTIELALQGRVPVKVHGPVAKGDLMVSGPNGHAVANNMARAGTIIGKALENFEGGSGIIEVVVGKV
jgi:hypothetical protein